MIDIDGEPFESVNIKTLDWDSQVLGLRSAALADMTVLKKDTQFPPLHYTPLVAELRGWGMQYVIARRPQSEWTRIHALERSGFRAIDGILEFGKALPNYSPVNLPEGLMLRLATERDAESVGRLAQQTFTKSRFHNDPILNKTQTDRVHFEWGKNACLGIAAQGVWLVERETHLAGFITCNLNGTTGSIGLVGVNAADAGQGLGVALVAKACQWFSEKKCIQVRVQTQTDNHAAIRLYGKFSFDPLSTQVTLRWAASE